MGNLIGEIMFKHGWLENASFIEDFPSEVNFHFSGISQLAMFDYLTIYIYMYTYVYMYIYIYM